MGLLDSITNVAKIPFDIGSQLIQANANKQAQFRQNRMNQQMADLEWQRNQEMWTKQNEYNSPASQMKRFQDAGLNPNLMYGQGSSGTSTTIPKYQAPEKRTSAFVPDFTNVLSQYQDMRVKNAQIKGLEADAMIKDSTAKFAMAMNEAKLYEMRQKGQISEAQFIKAQNELRATWGDKFTTTWAYNPPRRTMGTERNVATTDWSDTFRKQTTSKIEQAQGQIGLAKLLQGIRQKELDFLDNGGKYYNFIMQFFKMITNGL